MIRQLTSQERWELSRHTDWAALRDGLFEADMTQPLEQWLLAGLMEAIEKAEREVVWLAPTSDRRVR